MLFVALLLLFTAVSVDVRQRYLLGLDQPQVEVHVNLGDRLIEPAPLVQPDEFDRVTALMAAVAVPAGLMDLQGRGLLAVEGTADVSAAVGLETVVLHDLPGGDALLDDRGSFHDGHDSSLLDSVRMSMIRAPVSSLSQKWNSTPYFVDMVWIAL